MSRERNTLIISLYGKKHLTKIYNYIPLVWVNIHRKSKIEKQNKIYKLGKDDDRI